MKFDPEKHHRRSIRLKDYDYSQGGAYFVTICIANRECLLGEISAAQMRLNELGEIVNECWHRITEHFPNVASDCLVVMPNHIHGILVLTKDHQINLNDGDNVRRGGVTPPLHSANYDTIYRPQLGQIIAYFKYQTTKQINKIFDTPGARRWQRNYYEHIIRNQAELERIQEYIMQNPLGWDRDQDNPNSLRNNTFTRSAPWNQSQFLR